MQSPLDIVQTAHQYNLDDELTEKLKAFDAFIWQECKIQSVDELVDFEKTYQEYSKFFDFCYDNEVGEFAPVYLCNGEMTLLCKGAFQRTTHHKEDNPLFQKFIEAGLNDLESVMVISFLAEISGLYRKDSYVFGIPPFIQSVCEVLDTAISKLPSYTGMVVRACNEYDRADFQVGDIFVPGFCLTTSADLTWENESENRYCIQLLQSELTKARSIYSIHDISEKQVSFLQNVRFRICGISEWGEGKKEIWMEEI